MYINQINTNVYIADASGEKALQGDAATLANHKSVTDNPAVFAVVDAIPDNYNLLIYQEASA